MQIFQPTHLLVQSETGKAVSIPSNKLDNGKIDGATSVRLSSLTYTNTMTSFTATDKTFIIELYPYTMDDFASETPVIVTLQMDTTKRYTLVTLVADMLSKLAALAAILYTVNIGANAGTHSLLPSDYLAFDVFPDQGLLEITVKKSWYANIKTNLKLGFHEDTLYNNPMYQAYLNTSTNPPTSAQIEASEYKVYGKYLIQLSPTDVLHVTCSMCDGVDFISNLERSSQKILHTVGVASYCPVLRK